MAKATSGKQIRPGTQQEGGFPAPNGGRVEGGLGVNEFLLAHPHSTRAFAVNTAAFAAEGILPGDFILVDTAREPYQGGLTAVCCDHEFALRRFAPPLRDYPAAAGTPEYAAAAGGPDGSTQLLGPVCAVVRRLRGE